MTHRAMESVLTSNGVGVTDDVYEYETAEGAASVRIKD